MPSIGKVEGTLKLEDQYSGELKKFNSGLGSAGAASKALGAAMAAAAVAGVAALAKLTTEAVKAADIQIRAEQKLSAALRLSGQTAQGALEDFKAYASGIQAVTTVGDEAVLSMAQVATSMGLPAEAAKIAVKEAIGLAKAFGIAERSAIRYTAGLAEGDTTMLNRYIPTLRNVEDETERVALAHKLLGDAFSISMEEARSGLGPLTQFKNITGDLLEEMGRLVLEGMQPAIEGLTAIASSEDAKLFFESLGAVIGGVIRVFTTFVSVLSRGVEKIVASWGRAFLKLHFFLDDIPLSGFEELSDVVGAAGLMMLRFAEPAQKAKADIEGVAAALGKKGGGGGEGVVPRFEDFIDVVEEATPVLNTYLAALKQLIKEAEALDALHSLGESVLGPAKGLPSSIPFLKVLKDGTVVAVKEGAEEGLEAAAGGGALQGFGQSLAHIVADALYTALTGGELDWEQIGGQIGNALGNAIAGPIGAAVGQWVGESIGKLFGGDPNRSQGGFGFGQGYTNQSGTAAFQDQFSAALQQIEDFVATVEELIGGSVQFLQTMEVEVKKQGQSILRIYDSLTGQLISQQSFASQQEAIDAGLEQLLSTALLHAEGVMAEVFAEVLANAVTVGLEATTEALEQLSEMGDFLQGLDPLFDSTLSKIDGFRETLDSLGLSAEATAAVLEALAAAETSRLQTLESGWYGELFAIWERLGINQTQLANERAKMEQLQAQITLERLKAEAEFYGFLTPALEAILNGLIEAANDISNFRVRIPRLHIPKFGGGGGGVGSSSKPSGPTKDERITSLMDEWERFVSSGSKVRGFNAELKELTQTFFGPGGWAERFKELGLSTKQITAEFARMSGELRSRAFEGIRNVLRDLQLGTGGFGGASMSQQFFSQKSEFNRLAGLARGGDLDAAEQLGQFSRTYIETIRSMYGGSRKGRQLIEQVQASLEGIVGVGEDQQTVLARERNGALYDIRKLLGGEGRPMEDLATHQKDALIEVRKHTRLMTQANSDLATVAKEAKRTAYELTEARRQRPRRTFRLSDAEVKYASGGST